MKRIKNIGILTSGFADWAGGAYYLKQMLNALESDNSHRIIIFKKISLKQYLFRLKTSKNRFFDEIVVDYQEKKQISYLTSIDLFIWCLVFKINLIGPCIRPLAGWFPIRWFAWIADFQHKYLPENFSDHELAQRDRLFETLLNRADAVLLSEGQPYEDAISFYNADPQKIYCLPSMFKPKLEWLKDERNLSEKYNIHRPYFICCNQLHVHKDHITLLKAFSEFVSEGNDIDLVCTGDLSDYRNPKHLSEIEKLIKTKGIGERVKLLGLIPKNDQMNLLKHSIAAIQPSLFEGGPGGGAAFDAECLGKRIVMSDTKINKQSTYTNVAYFTANSDRALLAALRQNGIKNTHQIDVDILMMNGQTRLRRASQVLNTMICHVVKR